MSFVWTAVSDDDMPPFAGREHFSRAILFRLGLEKLAPPDCRRVIYLDADITVLADVREGRGTLGKLATDEALYANLRDA